MCRRSSPRHDRRRVGTRDAKGICAWLAEELPFLVAISENGAVMGFARVSPYSDRCVYSRVAEHGVYVARNARGGGIGAQLLRALASECAAAGIYKLTSRVFTDNAASRTAHRAAGFEEVGIQRRHGKLDGIWKDCVLVERLLGEAAES
jgi:L-amino acid N-acyltransferase YncA